MVRGSSASGLPALDPVPVTVSFALLLASEKKLRSNFVVCELPVHDIFATGPAWKPKLRGAAWTAGLNAIAAAQRPGIIRLSFMGGASLGVLTVASPN